MNTKKIWASLKQQEGECACPRLQLLFEHGRRTQDLYDDFEARMSILKEARDDSPELRNRAMAIRAAARRGEKLYYEMAEELLEEEYVTIVLHEAGPNGEIRSRTATWDEFAHAKGQLFTLNCATCGQILMASKRPSTPYEELN